MRTIARGVDLDIGIRVITLKFDYYPRRSRIKHSLVEEHCRQKHVAAPAKVGEGGG